MRPSIALPTDGTSVRWPGGQGTVTLSGEFHGASVQVFVAPRAGTPAAESSGRTPRAVGDPLTAPGTVNLPALPPLDLSIVVTGGESPSISAIAQPFVEH